MIQVDDYWIKAQGGFVGGLWKYEFTLHVLLRTHLAIESELEKTLELLLFKPQLLESMKLSFAQKATLVEALCSQYPVPWIHVKKLNSFRNRLAHRLDDDALIQEIDQFISTVLGEYNQPVDDLSNMQDDARDEARKPLVQFLGLRLFTEVSALRKSIMDARSAA